MPAVLKVAVVSTALGLAKVVMPGPLVWVQVVVTLVVGLPSSVTVASRVAPWGRVMLWSVPALTTGAWLGVPPPPEPDSKAPRSGALPA